MACVRSLALRMNLTLMLNKSLMLESVALLPHFHALTSHPRLKPGALTACVWVWELLLR